MQSHVSNRVPPTSGKPKMRGTWDVRVFRTFWCDDKGDGLGLEMEWDGGQKVMSVQVKVGLGTNRDLKPTVNLAWSEMSLPLGLGLVREEDRALG